MLILLTSIITITIIITSSPRRSRREFGNTIMTKPFTHVLPYLVGMLVGWSLLNSKPSRADDPESRPSNLIETTTGSAGGGGSGGKISLTTLAGFVATCIALVELFLPYNWNNSHLPSKMIASIYAALFRLGWSLVLAYIVITCRHRQGHRCRLSRSAAGLNAPAADMYSEAIQQPTIAPEAPVGARIGREYCFCPNGGNYMNRLLSLGIFSHLSKLSLVAYLIHLPLMSVFVGQTRGLFAFSHTLVIHLAISYLVITFILAFILVHIIEFPFLTFERLLFASLRTKTGRAPCENSGRLANGPSGGDRNLQKLKSSLRHEMTGFKPRDPRHSNECVATNHNHNHRSTRSDSGDVCERL